MVFAGTSLWFNPYMFSAVAPATDPYFGYVTLLLHGDGNFTDSSSYGNTLTNNTSSTGTTTSSSIYKFGTGSLSFNGTSELTTASSSQFTFGTNNFTMEFWFYVTNLSGICISKLLYYRK